MGPYSAKIVAIDQINGGGTLCEIHIMDWNERDNIGNIFLKVFSILALLCPFWNLLLFSE